MQSNNTSGSVLYSPCDVPTIPGVRVCMDKTRVEYLLSKCSDQFICSLKNKATFILYSTKSQKLLPQSGLCCTDPTITSTWRQWEGKMYFSRKKPQGGAATCHNWLRVRQEKQKTLKQKVRRGE